MFLATKLTASGRGYNGDGVGGQASFERSLVRLKTRKVDLLQIHNLDGVETLLPQLREWQQAGRIRYVGITTSRVAQHGQMIDFMRRYPLDFVQVDYSIDNRDAAQTLLPLAQERHIAVLANVPFGFGNVLKQAQGRKLPPWAADLDVTSWAQFLLKYVISHPAITVAIPGSTQVAPTYWLNEKNGVSTGMRRAAETSAGIPVGVGGIRIVREIGDLDAGTGVLDAVLDTVRGLLRRRNGAAGIEAIIQ